MARGLTDLEVKNAKGRVSESPGLECDVTRAGTKIWLYRYPNPIAGASPKYRRMSLGLYPDVSLTEARRLRDEALKLVKAGFDPLDVKKHGDMSKMTFGEFARHVAPDIAPKAKTDHATWIRQMTEHVGVLAQMRPADIQAKHVAAALRPSWNKNYPKAKRLRQRIERVLFTAKARGAILDSEWRGNVAVWKGSLEGQEGLRKRKRGKRHYPSLPYPQLPGFLFRLRRERKTNSALCLEWQIHAACRPSEACGTRWCEIDLWARTWTIPVERLKTQDEEDDTAQPHVVPLTLGMVRILMRARRKGTPQPDDLIFPNPRSRPVAGAVYFRGALRQLLAYFYPAGMASPHGFRSTFADWAKEAGYSRELVDLQLAHKVGDETSSAYQRSKLVELRRPMMTEWSRYCAKVEALKPVLRLAA